MNIILTCKICGENFIVPHWRKHTAKYCSKKCAAIGARASPNVTCTQCGKAFHLKQIQITRYKRHDGYFCSRKCYAKYKVKSMAGKNNHQYGLKGPLNASFKGEIIKNQNHNLIDLRIYVPDHPFKDKDDRILYHRYLVEQNYDKFDPACFVEIEGKKYLSRSFIVHHKDQNHNNNSIENLEIVTKGQHTRIHNKARKCLRDPVTGRFICIKETVNNQERKISNEIGLHRYGRRNQQKL